MRGLWKATGKPISWMNRGRPTTSGKFGTGQAAALSRAAAKHTTVAERKCTTEIIVPRQLYLPDSRRLVLPVHLLCLAPLPGCISPVAGDVKFEDDGVVQHPVDGRGSGHGVGKDALPLGEDQV